MNPEEKKPWQAIWKEEAARREERIAAADVERTDKRTQSLTPPLMTDEIRAAEVVSSHDVEILKPEVPPPDRYSEVVWTCPPLPSEYPRPYLPKPVVRRHRRALRR